MNAVTSLSRPPLDLVFAKRGGRTVLADRHVTYPFFVTAPLRGRGPDADIVVQSISGGLFGDERVRQRITVGAQAKAVIRMPSATIVHDKRDKAAAQFSVSLHLAAGATLHYLPRPVILLPGSALVQSIGLAIGPGATALIQDAVLMHDPIGIPAASRLLDGRISVRNLEGRLIALDRMLIDNERDAAGPYRAFGSLWFLDDKSSRLDQSLKTMISTQDKNCYWGVTRLRSDSGLMIRFAARDGGDLDIGMAAMREVLAPAFT